MKSKKTNGYTAALRHGRWIFVCVLGAFLAVFFWGENARFSQAKVKELDLSSKCSVRKKGKGQCQVTLSWKKKKADIYRIYRESGADVNGKIKYKKIATISGKRTKYRRNVRYNKEYSFKVVGYVKKAGRYRKKYCDTVIADPAGDLRWQNEVIEAYTTSPQCIQLNFFYNCDMSRMGRTVWKGINPTYIELERRVKGTSDFKRIKKISFKTLKKKHYEISYKDRDVTEGTIYEYRLRTVKEYKKNGKVRKLSCASHDYILTAAAVYDMPEVAVRILPQEETSLSYLILAVTNQPGNGDITFWNKFGYELTSCELTTDDMKDPFREKIKLEVTAASFDQTNWVNLTNKENQITVRTGETVYLKLEPLNQLPFSVSTSDPSICLKEIGLYYYNGLRWLLCDMSAGKGTTYNYNS